MIDVEPGSVEEAAQALADATRRRARVAFRGGGTKRGWGNPGAPVDVALSTRRLDGPIEHNPGDLTAVLGAGVPLARARAALAREGQELPLDPPLGRDEGATVGGVVATGDSGPLRHRYGAPRDLLLGMTVALSDGTVARSGGRVIKNVAGYDLPKLFAGSFGTLGLIAEVVVRLRPLPARTASAVGTTDDPALVQAGALALAGARLEPESLDVFWRAGAGGVAARVGGAAPGPQAEAAVRVLRRAGIEARVEAEDDALWSAQREGQRAAGGAVVKVSGLPTRLAALLGAAASWGAEVVGMAALGVTWVRLPPADDADLVAAVDDLRARLGASACALADAPEAVRSKAGAWPEPAPAELALMRRGKARFDPGGTCNAGVFVGGI